MAKILIVEDERVIAWNIEQILKIFNHEVVAVTSLASEAIRLAAEARPDLVLMDIRLQGQPLGIKAAQQIQTNLKIPVIYLTAHADDQTLKQAIATAPFGYILKPFNRLELHATIETALRRHQAETQLRQLQQWFATTLNSIGDPTIAVDPQGCITFINAAAEAFTGWHQAEALGQPIERVLNLTHIDTDEVIEHPLRVALQQGKRVQCPESLVRTRNGLERIVGDSAAPVKNDRGEIIGGVLVFQDITDRQKAEKFRQIWVTQLEKQVQESMAQLQQVFRFETVLEKITHQIRDSLDENQILQTAVDELKTALEIDCCNITLYDLEQQVFTIRYESATCATPFLGDMLSVVNFSSEFDPLLQGHSLQFCELSVVRSAVFAYPILDSRGILGVLWLSHTPDRTFHTTEIRLVQQIATQCAITLRRSRLCQVAQF